MTRCIDFLKNKQICLVTFGLKKLSVTCFYLLTIKKEDKIVLAFDKNNKIVSTKKPVAIAYTTQKIVTYNKICYSCGHSINHGAQTKEINFYILSDGSVQTELPKYKSIVGSKYVPKWNIEKLHMPKRIHDNIVMALPDDVSGTNIIKKNYMCCGCKKAETHKNDIVNHGLSAFNVCDFNEIINRIDKIRKNKNWQICCSNRNCICGSIGIAGTGNVISYFPVDIFSKKGKEGRREVNIPFKCLKIDENEWVLNDEYIVNNINMLYMWAERYWFYEELDEQKRNIIFRIAKKNNVPLVLFVEDHSDFESEGVHYIASRVVEIYGNKHYQFESPQYVDDIMDKLVMKKNYDKETNVFIGQINKRKNVDDSIDYNQVFKAARAALYNKQQVTIEELKQFINTMVKNGHLRFTKSKDGFINFYV